VKAQAATLRDKYLSFPNILQRVMFPRNINTMKSKYSVFLISAALIASAAADLSSVYNSPVYFAVLGHSAVTFTNTKVDGYVGVTPGGAFTQTDSAIVGDLYVNGSAVTFTNSVVDGDVSAAIDGAFTQTDSLVTGTVSNKDAYLAPSAYDLFLDGYDAIAAEPGEIDLTGQSLAGMSLKPGIYYFDAAVAETGGVLTLDGEWYDNWVFKVGTGGTGALTFTNFTVTMRNGEIYEDQVIWWTAEAATLTDSTLIGSIYAGSSATITRGKLDGKVLAESAVTLTNTVISGFSGDTGGGGAGGPQ
jgi:hypothetical protein